MTKLNVAIIGTRGIPNHYGGFEQFTEYLAKGLVDRGHSITVYNSHSHPYKENNWKGIKLIHQYDPEDKIGTIGQFIYDYNCIRDLKHHNFDIVLQLGYTSNSVWYKFLPTKPIIITNMDGLEWKRSKYNAVTQRFLKHAEKLAAINSDILIADSLGIKDHLESTYDLQSNFIPYGANLFKNPDKNVLMEYSLDPYGYNLLIARMEPENNIEVIIRGHLKSKTKSKLILVGNIDTHFGKYLNSKYRNSLIFFLGGIYDQSKLDNLRYYSNLYFHGHSVGGTNPSLLEAMASNSLVCAHDNIFNRSILQKDAYYFSDANGIEGILRLNHEPTLKSDKIRNNEIKIKNTYSWKAVIDQYEDLFYKSLNNV